MQFWCVQYVDVTVHISYEDKGRFRRWNEFLHDGTIKAKLLVHKIWTTASNEFDVKHVES